MISSGHKVVNDIKVTLPSP